MTTLVGVAQCGWSGQICDLSHLCVSFLFSFFVRYVMYSCSLQISDDDDDNNNNNNNNHDITDNVYGAVTMIMMIMMTTSVSELDQKVGGSSVRLSIGSPCVRVSTIN